MKTYSGTAAALSHTQLESVFAYRHSVFVERLGWDLPGARGGLEVDQFDRLDTIHVGAIDDAGAMCGCARLLPTNRPYLLGEVFPDLMNGEPIPRGSEIWEISRFAAVDLAASSTQQVDIWTGREVLAECVRCALAFNIERFITVSPLGIEKLLRKVGVNARRAGPPMRLQGHALYACWIEIDDMTLEALDLSTLEMLA